MYEFDYNEYVEKQKFTRAANCIGAAYAFLLLLNFLIEWALEAFAFFAGDKAYNAVFANPYVAGLTDIFFSVLLFVPPFIIALRVFGGRVRSVAAFRRPKKNAFLFFLVGIGGCQLGDCFAFLFDTVFTYFGISSDNNQNVAVDKGLPLFVLTFMSVAVVAPLVEEFAMRGVMLGVMRPFGEGEAIFASAFMFAIMHQSIALLPFTFMAGLVLGFVAVKSGSVWTAIAVHAFNNALSMVMSLPKNGKIFDAAMLAVIIIQLSVGLWAFYALSRRDADLMSFKSGCITAAPRKKLSWFFSSPVVIISLVGSVIMYFMRQVGI